MVRNLISAFLLRRSSTHRRPQGNVRPWAETLEDRCVPTTTTSFASGILTITGDAGNNTITVTEQAAPGSYQVAAADLAGTPLLFANVKTIKVNTLDGTDSVTFNGNAAANTVLPGTLAVAGAGGLTININNNVNVVGPVNLFHSGVAGNLNANVNGNGIQLGPVTITDGDSNSTTNIQNGVTIKGFLTLNLGGGNNNVTVNNATITGSLSETGGAGNDVITITNAVISGNLGANMGAGTNQLAVNAGVVVGKASVVTAGQNETIAVQNGALVKGLFFVSKTSDTGNLSVSLSQNAAVRGAFTVLSGAGTEALSIDGRVGGSVAVDFKAGISVININGASLIGGSLTHATTGSLDFVLSTDSAVAGAVLLNKNNSATATLDVQIDESHVGSLTLNGGGFGSNVFFINNASIGGNLMANLGAGNNQTVSVTRSTVGGGAFVNCTGEVDFQMAGSSVLGAVSINAVVSTTATIDAALSDSSVNLSLTINGGQNVDQVGIVDSVIFGKTLLNLGAGADTINTSNSRFTGAAMFTLGAGADVVNLQNTAGTNTQFSGAFTLLGGTEDDTVTLGTGTGQARFFGITSLQGGSGAGAGLNRLIHVNAGFANLGNPPNFVNFLVTPLQVFAITGNSLFAFDAGTPGTIVNPGGAGSNAPVAITNLVGAAGETVVGIDFRPLNGLLFALTRDNANVGRLYTLSLSAGTFAQATLVATINIPLAGTAFGVDFNPTDDRLRIVSNTGQNLSVSPVTGVAIVNSNLNPNNLDVVGAAYSNNFNGAATTKLFHLASGNDTLRFQNPAGSGILTGIGMLGVDTDTNVGFDIGFGNTAYASLTTGAASDFYVIDLTTGAATLVGDIGGAGVGVVTGIAVR